jgi:hypothetical protein
VRVDCCRSLRPPGLQPSRTSSRSVRWRCHSRRLRAMNVEQWRMSVLSPSCCAVPSVRAILPSLSGLDTDRSAAKANSTARNVVRRRLGTVIQSTNSAARPGRWTWRRLRRKRRQRSRLSTDASSPSCANQRQSRACRNGPVRWPSAELNQVKLKSASQNLSPTRRSSLPFPSKPSTRHP